MTPEGRRSRGRGWRARRGRQLLALGCLLFLPLGCGGCGDRANRDAAAAHSTPVAALGGTELEPIPLPDLSTADPAVLRQVEERKATVDRLLAGRDAQGEDGPNRAELDAELAEAYGDLAKALMSYQLSESADAALANAHRLAPDDLRWAYLLGYLRFLSGDPVAEELLNHALDLQPDYLPTLVRLADLKLAAGDEPEATRYFNQALALDDSIAAVHAGLGRAAAARGEHGAAVKHYRRALELQPDASSLHYLLGQALRREGDLEAAQRELAQAGDGPVQFADPLFLEISGLAEGFQFYAVQGAEAASDGRWEQAAAAFTKALEYEPDSFMARQSLGYAFLRMGDTIGAERELLLALEEVTRQEGASSGDAAQVSSLMVSLLLPQGRDREALPHLQRSLAHFDEGEARAGQRLVLADTQARLGLLSEALTSYDRVLASPGGDTAATRVRRATVLVNLGRGDEALAEFRRAVDSSPDAAGVRLRYAEALEFLGRPGEADAQRQRARELSSSGDQKIARLAGEGRLAASKGDFDTAAQRYREALTDSPDRHDIRMALAGALAARGRYDAALGEYQRILQADPDHTNARRAQIAALILSERYGPARVELNEALRRSTRDLGLAMTQARLLAAAPDARVRDGALALQVARRIEEADQGLMARDTLAMALAEAGQTAEAARVQQGVVDEAGGGGVPDDVRREMAERLAVFRAGRQWTAGNPRQLLALGGPAPGLQP